MKSCGELARRNLNNENMIKMRMNNSIKKRNEKTATDVTIVLLSLCVILLALSAYSTILAFYNTSYLAESFSILALEGLFYVTLILIRAIKRDVYIFEPFTIITILFIMLFFLAPLFQFALGSTSRYGIDVSKNCTKGTLVTMIGYLSFYIAYNLRKTSKETDNRKQLSIYSEPNSQIAKVLVRVSLVIWVAAYFLNIYYYMNRGFSLAYIILGGLTGKNDMSTTNSSYEFLSYCRFILLGSWITIYVYGEKKGIKLLLYMLTLLSMFLSGGRLTLLIALLTPMVYHYIQEQTSPPMTLMSILLIMTVLLFAFMQIAREGVRVGAGIQLRGKSLLEMFKPFISEVDDFKLYYALFDVVPKQQSYLLGRQMIIYSFIILIPRAIFPNKPDPLLDRIIFLALGEQAVANANAYPAIGEYYVEFGLPGVILLMALLGRFSKYCCDWYLRSSGKSISLILYSIIWPTFILIVIRGYFPMVSAILIFMYLPIIINLFIIRLYQSSFIESQY